MAKKKTSIEIDEDLWRKARVWAAREGRSVGDLIDEALRVRLDQALTPAQGSAIDALLKDRRKARSPKKGGRR